MKFYYVKRIKDHTKQILKLNSICHHTLKSNRKLLQNNPTEFEID